MSAVRYLRKFLYLFCTLLLFETACGDWAKFFATQNANFIKRNGVDEKTYQITKDPETHKLEEKIFCDSEPYEHFYLLETNEKVSHMNRWKKTGVGEFGLLEDECRNPTNRLPLIRSCEKDSVTHKGVWGDISHWGTIECIGNIKSLDPTNSTKSILAGTADNMSDQRFYCHTESFEHFYLVETNKKTPHKNRWRKTVVGDIGTLEDVCLLANGLPVSRRCLKDAVNHQAVWENISHWSSIQCINQTRQLIISNELNSMQLQLDMGAHLKADLEMRRNWMQQIQKLVQTERAKILPADVHSITVLMKQLVSGTTDIPMSCYMLGICDTLMSKHHSDRRALRLSLQFNATNKLLDTFETYKDNIAEHMVPSSKCNVTVDKSADTASARDENKVQYMDKSDLGVYAEFMPNICVFYINPNCAQISGIAIYDLNAVSSGRKLYHWQYENGFKYGFINYGEQIEDLRKEPNLQMATFIPESLWRNISGKLKNPTVVIKLYGNDALFAEIQGNLSAKPSGKVLSISIPNYDQDFSEPLTFLMRTESAQSSSDARNSSCAYWNYNTWAKDGVQTDAMHSQQGILLCTTNHLTQFSFLIEGKFDQSDFGNAELITVPYGLDLITLIGCTLSLFGLSGIWLSAALVKKWRSMPSTKILLNMCVALTLQMVLILFVNNNDITEKLMRYGDKELCIFIGALLQYATLALFVWMLIVALLQFQRYVTVIGIKRPEHYIFKAALLAWLLPLLPILLLVFIDVNSYLPSDRELQDNTGICYPSGLGFIMGVLAPVVIVVSANSVIFVYVLYSITHTLQQTIQRVQRQMIKKQLQLSILLFFLLGLSWIFGIFSFMKINVIFSYLFCMTATLQGFVLFIYFVILDEVARSGWMELLCAGKHKKNIHKRMPELTSLATTTTSMPISGAGSDHHYH